ncbi:hypothetical protein H2201_004835 [Coniosporium apollinis]|uniref:Heterokaryon incompatibility domain-containing protein n=2 Tax=Coniosporium TaxID=2810619 RepID=A0ABQ9NVA6_9PEZI|nr:hypothetical protein H2199_004555 [Cladosporium sp. JES 115]KAJ9664971.1 hypothetical protein H2201_004835 [Coniosporium apollinis]
MSQKGYVGLCPKSARKGDVIAVLPGGMVPFILRPLNDSQPTYYTLVGESYVHGIMDGEAILEQRRKGDELHEFAIK